MPLPRKPALRMLGMRVRVGGTAGNSGATDLATDAWPPRTPALHVKSWQANQTLPP